MNRFNPISGVTRADIRYDPYPHVVVENALPTDVFAELEATFPAERVLARGEEWKNRKLSLNAVETVIADGIAPIWREFTNYCSSDEFFRSVVKLFGAELQSLYPFLANEFGCPLEQIETKKRVRSERKGAHRRDSVVMDCQIVLDDTTNARTCRGPHVDAPAELYAGLIYFRSIEDTSTGGDLQVLRSTNPKMRFPFDHSVLVDRVPAEIDGADLEVVSTVPYAANTAVFFVNGPRALHGVSERSAASVGRRHVNIIGESYSLKRGGLFTVQHADGRLQGAKPSAFSRVRRALGR